MARRLLSNRQWKRIKPLLPGKPTDPGRTGSDNRLTLEGILWIARTGAPWRDLPQEFGKWNSIYKRFRRWVQRGIFDAIFESVAEMLDLGIIMVDGTFIKVHQHGAGAPKETAHQTSPARLRPLG